MAKLCPAGKAAAKRKFKVYPSAYANIWASKYCKGKVGRKKKAGGGMMRDGYKKGGSVKSKIATGCGKVMAGKRKKTKYV